MDGVKNIKHYLEFVNDSTGRIQISEPTGFDGVKFLIQQERGRFGRDVSFTDVDFEFNPNVSVNGLTHEFKNIIRYDKTYGYESIVYYILKTPSQEFVMGQLDYPNRETDQIKYFKCKVIQVNLKAKIKRHFDTEINIFSNNTLSMQDINPVSTEKVLIPGNPELKISEWELPQEVSGRYLRAGMNSFSGTIGLTSQINRSQIENTLSPQLGVVFIDSQNTVLIEAQESLSNIIINISEFSYTSDSGVSGIWFFLESGFDFNNRTRIVNIDFPRNGNLESLEQQVFVNINANEFIWGWFQILGNSVSGNTTFTSCKLQISAVSTPIDTIGEHVRLIDAINNVVESITDENQVEAPRFEISGEFYNQYITTGILFRGLPERDFNLSFQQIIKYLSEINGDYQINDDNIFFGIYEDFYRDVEIARYTMHLSEEFILRYNPRYKINSYNFKYKKYERGQNNGITNSRRGVHTEAQLTLPNVQVENDINKEVEFIRDPFRLDEVRLQSVRLNPEVAQEDDDDIFINDVLEVEDVQTRFISSQLQHSILSIDGIQSLSLNNDGSFGFNLLGLTEGDLVSIGLNRNNEGNYNVQSVNRRTLVLTPQPSTISNGRPNFQGVDNTLLVYSLSSINKILKTNEDFVEIINTASTRGIANLNFSIKRNILNYHRDYLATCCEYSRQNEIIINKYRHNREAGTRKRGERGLTIEGGNINKNQLGQGILSPQSADATILIDFNEFVRLQKDIQEKRGYIILIDNLGNEFKVHPTKIEYEISTGILELKDAEIRN